MVVKFVDEEFYLDVTWDSFYGGGAEGQRNENLSRREFTKVGTTLHSLAPRI
jgi:hypothetical protein